MNKSLRIISSRKIIVLLACLVIGGGIWLWNGVLKDYIVPKRFGVVEEGLIYRSGMMPPRVMKKTLLRYKIKVIVDLTGNSDTDSWKIYEKQASADLGIERMIFPLRGNGTGDTRTYADAIVLICRARKEQKPVLVHCDAGAQRTGGVIAVYRLLVERKDSEFVRSEMMQYGVKPAHDINLINFLNSHMAEFAALLKQMGVIDAVPASMPQIRG